MTSMLKTFHSVLAATPARWQHLAQAVPPDLLTLRPAPAEWSAGECLLHLLDTERFVFPVRVRAFLAGQDFPAFDPGTPGGALQPGQDILALIEEFARLRRQSVDLLASLLPGDLARTVRHAELGPVTLEHMLNEWAAHDLDHTIQAERALMQPFIAGCGPWQIYFTANRFT